jgi:quinol monooxygenase YgiN
MKELATIVEKEEPGCLSYGLFTNKEGHVIVFER